jgi:membrane protease subunit (stomatin/prohibitin family)
MENTKTSQKINVRNNDQSQQSVSNEQKRMNNKTNFGSNCGAITTANASGNIVYNKRKMSSSFMILLHFRK